MLVSLSFCFFIYRIKKKLNSFKVIGSVKLVRIIYSEDFVFNNVK